VALFRLELETRTAAEPEADVLRELEERIPEGGDSAALMRVALAQRQLQRGDATAALRVLGDELPQGADHARSLWFDTLGIAHAMNDDLASTRATYRRWQEAGGRPAEVRARYALALSISGLADPEIDLIKALRDGLRDAAALGDDKLEQTVAIRLLFTLVASGRASEALAAYDRLQERIPLPGIREELERAQQGRELARDPAGAGRGTVSFRLARGAPGATLSLSPDPGSPADADYQRHAISVEAPVQVERASAVAPLRWVLSGKDRSVLASGAIAVRAGQKREVEIVPDPVHSAPAHVALARKPGDGRRRVALVLLDCGDWAISQYLRARGELPVFDALLASGYHAVLDSDPPLTAAALESLVWPERRAGASIAGTFYRFGIELAGLESVGSNPFEALSWVLPESHDLFGAIGAGERSAANLLLAHGGIRAGRHGLVTGPHGEEERLELGRTRRALDAGERARFPLLAAASDPIDVHYIETIAAEFDATSELLRKNEIDLIAVRIEPFDILTHKHFAEAARDRQDDGQALLFDVYRYADARIGALHEYLDADDVLIVMSDHGIRTAMEHDRPALFVATGPGVPAGRAPGSPALRGVSRVLADLLGVETKWPDTGVAGWASAVAVAK
jgi:type I phosphodiesterase/nucleotide pyrophosphatase